jgi:uncharacterized membrane protein YedE/YeeE
MSFTPVESLIGGVLIGTAASCSIMVDGKIMGISGIIGPFLRGSLGGKATALMWKGLFIAGMVAGGLVNLANVDMAFPAVLHFSIVRYLIAAVCVGGGTRMCGGCTSGHGVCGLARFSFRSLVAVPTFMGVAAVALQLAYLATDMPPVDPKVAPLQWPPQWQFPVAAAIGSLLLVVAMVTVPNSQPVFSASATGLIFGLGLGVSGMTSQAKVLGFLDVLHTWDPSLAFVMGGALCVTFPAFYRTRQEGACPFAKDQKYETPKTWPADWKLVVGSALFGTGWGLTGVCPGPAAVIIIPNFVLLPSHPENHYAPSLLAFFVVMCATWLVTDRVLTGRPEPAPAKEPQTTPDTVPIATA